MDEGAQERGGADDAAIAARRPGLLTFALAAGLGLAGLVVLFALRQHGPVIPGFRLSWPAIALVSAVAEMLVFDLEIRGEAHTFTLSEVAVILGLLFASPLQLVLGRLVGEVAVLVLRDRQRAVKLAFNVALFTSEAAVAAGVLSLLHVPAHIGDPRTWFGTAVAMTAADLVTALSVAAVIAWHGGRPDRRQLLFFAGLTAVVNIAIALIAAILLVDQPTGLALLGLVAVIVFACYRGYASLSQRYANLSQLYEFTRIVSGSVKAEDVVEAILVQTLELMRAGTAEVLLPAAPGSGPGVRLLVEAGQAIVAETLPDDVDIAALTATPSDGAVVLDCERRAAWAKRRRKVGQDDSLSVALLAEGDAFGVMTVRHRLGDVSAFDAADAQLFGTLANHAAVALQNSRLVTRLLFEAKEREHEGTHDALTGLINRAHFLRVVQSALGDGAIPAVVMLIDLDRFKEVNDTLGHHIGDQLLQQVALRLVGAVPDDAIVARLGGDEFALFVPGVTTDDDATAVARQVRDALHAPLRASGVNLELGGSIGIARSPEHGEDVGTLLQRADVAMYAAKTGPEIAVYQANDDGYTHRRLTLASELRSAIEAGQLTARFQAKARLADGRITSAEALARWEHPLLGLVPPDEFIPIAEQSGLVTLLTQRMLDLALDALVDFERQGHVIDVAVNLSVRSLLDSALPELVQERLRAHGLAPERLTLEITESSMMTDPTRSIAVLDQLDAIGVRLSIDDFGTGYSSLGYLQRLHADEVKIDKSFVAAMADDAGSEAIVRSVIGLGRSLSLKVVAEGIEDRATWDRLRALGCETGQGYYLSRPVPAVELLALMASRAAMADVAAA